MHYRIKFKASSQEFVFEAMKYFVLARDVIQTVRNTFSMYKTELQIYHENGTIMDETDEVENVRTYIVKRLPSKVVLRKQRRKRYWYR